MTWGQFLVELKAAGGSTDMQTSKSGRYPFLFHFSRGETLTDVVVYASAGGKVIASPPRDWSTKELLVSDYKALLDHGGRFNDTNEALS